MTKTESLFELAISLDDLLSRNTILMTDGEASKKFSAAIRDYRNVLYFLEYDLRSQIPRRGHEGYQFGMNLYNACLRLSILEATTSRGTIRGTAIDSFSRREREKKELFPDLPGER